MGAQKGARAQEFAEIRPFLGSGVPGLGRLTRMVMTGMTVCQDPKAVTASSEGAVAIGDRVLHPRDLDAYATIAYELAGLREDDGGFGDGEDGPDDVDPEGLDTALEWARGGAVPRPRRSWSRGVRAGR